MKLSSRSKANLIFAFWQRASFCNKFSCWGKNAMTPTAKNEKMEGEKKVASKKESNTRDPRNFIS